MDSQNIRARKRPYNGTRNSMETEYSSSRNAGNEVVSSVSKYNSYDSDFEKENMIRQSAAADPILSYRDVYTIKEDIGESLPETADHIESKIVNPKEKFINHQFTESFDTDYNVMSITLFLLIISIAIISTYYMYHSYQDRKRKHIEKIEKDYKEIVETS